MQSLRKFVLTKLIDLKTRLHFNFYNVILNKLKYKRSCLLV